MKTSDEELIAAYLDGVSELDADERHRVEELLRDPAKRAESEQLRSTIGTLRALPHEGTEPDWSALERSIRTAVGSDVPRAWWRRWRYLVPIGALAVTAAIALIVIRHPAPEHVATRQIDAGVPAAPSEPTAESDQVWLDGQAVELGDIDPMVLLDDDATNDVADTGLLPVQDLRWVDSLDDSAADRAETWLAAKKKKG